MIKIIRMPEVKAKTGLSKTTIYELIAEGNFPEQIPLGSRIVGWINSEVEEWISERINQARKHNSQ